MPVVLFKDRMVPNCLIKLNSFYISLHQLSSKYIIFFMSTIFISETANTLIADYLRSQGHTVKIIGMSDITYNPVSSHPDIYMCSMGHDKPVFFGDPSKIGTKYPSNIIYNAACTGKFFLHNLKYTDPELLKAASSMQQIHVPQGYTKCNTLIIDENSIITSDKGIAKACSCKMDVCLITPGYIKLQGFDYGFIGGSSGRIDNTIVFNGDISKHPDYKKITDFIKARDLDIKYFTEYPLEDIGSIIVLPDFQEAPLCL